MRPWFRLKGTALETISRRCWRGLLRWPAHRFARLVGLAVVGGLGFHMMRDVGWVGAAVAGGAFYLTALEAEEALGEAILKEDLLSVVPMKRGLAEVRHLKVPSVVVSVVIGLSFGVAAVFLRGSSWDTPTYALGLLTGVAGAIAGAILSIVREWRPLFRMQDLRLPTEAMAMLLVWRVLAPAAVAVIGVMPLAATYQSILELPQGWTGFIQLSLVSLTISFGAIGWLLIRQRLRELRSKLGF